jgi:hypothetical protein
MSAGISLATAASVVGIAGGINSLTGGGITNALGLTKSTASTGVGSTTAAANPMAPYQAQLAQMYSGYLQPGANTNIQQMPGYTQFQTGVLDPALAANKATAASSGMLYSGNEAAALQTLGQNQYSTFMNNYMSQLGTAAGAGVNPGTGAQLGTSQQNLANTSVAQGFGALATGLNQFGTANPTPTGNSTLQSTYGATQMAGLSQTGEMGLVY